MTARPSRFNILRGWWTREELLPVYDGETPATDPTKLVEHDKRRLEMVDGKVHEWTVVEFLNV